MHDNPKDLLCELHEDMVSPMLEQNSLSGTAQSPDLNTTNIGIQSSRQRVSGINIVQLHSA